MFYDLNLALKDVLSSRSRERQTEACGNLPQVGIVALNGIPIIGKDVVTYFGVPITVDLLRRQLGLGLGFGGVLTYVNRTGLSLERLAEISLTQNHDWAMHSINVTLCFAGAPTFVEMSFARDRRFHLSWVESLSNEDWTQPRLFTATASWKDWRSFLKHRESPDFQSIVREWLCLVYWELYPIFPEYMG